MNYYRVVFLGIAFLSLAGAGVPPDESVSGVGGAIAKSVDPCKRDIPPCDDHNACTPDICVLRGSASRPAYADCGHGDANTNALYQNQHLPPGFPNACQKLTCDPIAGFQYTPKNPVDQCKVSSVNAAGYCETNNKAYGTPCDTSTPCSHKICQDGQCVAAPPGLNATIQVETRSWPGTPVPCTSIPAVEVVNTLPPGGKGYGIAQPTTLYNFANQALITGGSSKNLAYHIKLTIDVAVGHSGKWGFRVGPDFPFGGLILIDGSELVSRWKPMYWKGNFTDPTQSLTGSRSLQVGSHVVEVYGFSTGGDRQATMEVTAPGISTVWVTVTNVKVSACK